MTYSVQSGIFRPSQSSRLLTIAVASGKPLTSILTAAPSSGQLTRAHMRSVMSVYSISCCPVRPKAARNGAADVGLRDVVPDVQAGCCPTYLANSAVGSRPQGRTPEDPGPSVAICVLTVIPELSAWDRHCPAAWQQSWRNCLDPRPTMHHQYSGSLGPAASASLHCRVGLRAAGAAGCADDEVASTVMQVDPAIMPATTSAISAGLVARDFSLPCGCAGSGQRTRPDSWASFL